MRDLRVLWQAQANDALLRKDTHLAAEIIPVHVCIFDSILAVIRVEGRGKDKAIKTAYHLHLGDDLGL